MSATPLPSQSLDWPIAWPGVALIARAESCRLVAYLCPAGKWTCGWGETDGVTARTRWTQDYADRRFADSLREYAHAVLALCREPPNDHEMAAMVSLAYNTGVGNFGKSSVLRAHNRGDRQAAARAFGLWNKARVGGQLQVLRGLTARRAAEAALYLRPVEDLAAAEPMPQAVEPETRLAASPVARTAAVTAATGALTVISDMGQQAAEVRHMIEPVRATLTDDLGLAPITALGVLVMLAGVVILYWRWRQRDEGWA